MCRVASLRIWSAWGVVKSGSTLTHNAVTRCSTTRPLLTGSSPTTNTIGISAVANFAAKAAGRVIVAIRTTSRLTRSVASAGSRSKWPLKGHFECGCNRLRHGLDFVRVDDQGAVELSRSAGKPGKHEDTGILRVLSGDILLGDQVHAVAQRRHQAEMSGSENPRQRGPRI